MNSRIIKESGMSRMIMLSLMLHASLFVVAYMLVHFVIPQSPVKQAYYVELSSLPVLNPRSGTQKHEVIVHSTTRPSVRHEMNLPPVPVSKPVPRQTAPAMAKLQVSKKSMHFAGKQEPRPEPKPQHVEKKIESVRRQEQPPDDGAESEKEFNEHLARLEQNAESRHESEVLDALKKKISANAGIGVPNGSGRQAGSDYAGYVQSRLRDAFCATIAYQSRNPEVSVQLRISRFGRIIGWSMVKSSHDKLFEAAVARAIEMTGEKLPPPPGGETFEHGYVFRPQGVKKARG